MIVLRIVLYLLLALLGAFTLYVLFTCICALFVKKGKEYDKNSKFYRFLLYSWTSIALFLTQIKIHVTGMEKLPKGRFVLVGNHRSAYDPIVTWQAFKKYDLAFVSKEGNFHIPFFGRVIQRCCFMEIDRTNAKNALKTVARACKLIATDECSVAVYPEGTRNRGEGLLPFHNSVFKIAQKAVTPIVVVAVRGTEKIAERTPWRRSHMYLDVLEVIPAEEVISSRTVDLGERISTEILDHINICKGEKS